MKKLLIVSLIVLILTVTVGSVFGAAIFRPFYGSLNVTNGGILSVSNMNGLEIARGMGPMGFYLPYGSYIINASKVIWGGEGGPSVYTGRVQVNLSLPNQFVSIPMHSR